MPGTTFTSAAGATGRGGLARRRSSASANCSPAVEDELSKGKRPRDAVQAAHWRFRGAFALLHLFKDEENVPIGARRSAPPAIGYGDKELYLGSGALALATFTDRIAISRKAT